MILRLTDADRADNFDQSWTLDGSGNFSTFDDDGTSQDRSTNAANEITSLTGSWVDPAYDAAGNIIYGPQSGDETTGLHYVYDAWNRQVAVYTDDGDGVFEPDTDDTLLAEYEFDGANRRIEKVLSASSADYYYNNSWQLLEVRHSDGSINQHVFSPDYIDSPIVWRHDVNGDGDYLDAGDQLRYYLSDANHSTTAVVDSVTGLVVNRYVYTPYGDHTVYDASWSNPSAPTSDGIMYCGYFRDAETNNYQVRHRMYNTSLATWLSRDPIGYEANDANLYRYVWNSPVIYVDPSGMSAAGDRLATLCTAECKANAGSDCTIEQCKKEAEEIGKAYEAMFDEEEAIEWLWILRQIYDYCGGPPDDYRAGWMCYQWQTKTYNALKDLISKSKCFYQARVGHINKSGELQHNWVAITVGSAPTAGGVEGARGTARSGSCTAWADPWAEAGANIYLLQPNGKYDRPGSLNEPSDANFIVDENDMNSLDPPNKGERIFGPPDQPSGTTGWYFDEEGILRMRTFEGQWSW